MNSSFRLLALLGLVALTPGVRAQNKLPEGYERVELTVDGVAREALVHAPASAKTKRTPIVFGFSGHGGTAAQAARQFALNREWPEAISVSMQALPTPGRFIDFEGKESGWQLRKGHKDDRDFKFSDALLARLKKDYQVDDKRIYAMGLSSGGYFTLLLWAERGEVLAAVAPVAAEAADALPALKAKPMLLVAGEKDQRVKYDWMRKTMDAVRKLNGCEAKGSGWGDHCTLFASTTGTPVVEFIHSGGHDYPKGTSAAIVRFFKEHPPK